MNFSQYSSLAIRTANNDALPTDRDKFMNAALGLAGESGEVADHLKKVFYHGHEMDIPKLVKEAGDILWYINLLADALGMPLEEIAAQNISKLERRYPGGQFSTERSVNRIE
jgi:NTP pyrophosphatase (non-canonical NTP hydrolase)